MSRSTQYIGLTDSAEEFVTKYCERIPTENKTSGMFGEDVPLGEWKLNEAAKESFASSWARKDTLVVQEVVQTSPWSSGPMIFTCLMFAGEDGDYMFTWVLNPLLKLEHLEYDEKTGTYWV
jgi:hypothetical protein